MDVLMLILELIIFMLIYGPLLAVLLITIYLWRGNSLWLPWVAILFGLSLLFSIYSLDVTWPHSAYDLPIPYFLGAVILSVAVVSASLLALIKSIRFRREVQAVQVKRPKKSADKQDVEETRRAWLTLLLTVVASPLIFLGGTLLNLNGIITSLILFAVVGAIWAYLLILPERQRLAVEAAKPAKTIRAGREDLRSVLEKVIGSGREQIVTFTHRRTGQWIQAVGPGGWLFQLAIGEPGSEVEKRALNWITRWELHRVFGGDEPTIIASTDEEKPGLAADFVRDALRNVFEIDEGEELDLKIE